MYSNNRNGGRATRGRGFGALLAIMLAMGLGLVAQPAEAAPFAYVTNSGANTVSVIDIPTNKVVATVPVGFFPQELPSLRMGNTLMSQIFSLTMSR